MIEDYQSIVKINTWDTDPGHKGNLVVSSRWFIKIKHTTYRSTEKYKAIFFAWGFSQKEVINYKETFASIARYTLVRTIIAILASKGQKIHCMDIKIAFFNDILEEDIYPQKP